MDFDIQRIGISYSFTWVGVYNCVAFMAEVG